MEVQALLCARCGGELARPEVLPALITCAFCGTVTSVSRQRVETRPATPAEQRRLEAKAFGEAVAQAIAAGASAYPALRDAAAAHLGPTVQADVLARIVVALARDFERESGASVLADGLPMERLAEAYLLATDALQETDRTEISLPFLTATSSGPKHLERTVTAQTFAELARRDPDPPPAPTPAAAPPDPAVPVATTGATDAAPPGKKKRRWWPF